MAIPQLCGSPKRLTASGVLAVGSAMSGLANPLGDTALQASMLGFFLANHSSGTLVISTNNGGSAGTQITGTITFTASTYGWFDLPITSANGLYATIGGTADITFVIA